jgi:hypothetical protein
VARKDPKQSERPGRPAVMKRARELREQAVQARLRDPNANPYELTDAAAAKIYTDCVHRYGRDDAGIMALHRIGASQVRREDEAREESDRASRARAAHLAHQAEAAGGRDARRSRMSLGARLDAALLGLGMVSEAKGSPALDQQSVITGGKGGSGVPRTGDRHGDLASEALRLVERAERKAERARRLVIEEVAA